MVSQIAIDWILQKEHEAWLALPGNEDIRDDYPQWSDWNQGEDTQQILRNSARFIIETWEGLNGRG